MTHAQVAELLTHFKSLPKPIPPVFTSDPRVAAIMRFAGWKQIDYFNEIAYVFDDMDGREYFIYYPIDPDTYVHYFDSALLCKCYHFELDP